MKQISLLSKILVALASLTMIGSYFYPLWIIELWAPQYPEGLALYIWHNKLGGDVEIINGLNHYIGMAHLKQESFPEFGILPYLIGAFVGLGLLVAAIGRRKFLLAYVGLMVIAGITALVDFYRWGYEYGHNLDPSAAIKVPGMSYQPPVLGYKELLNFGAYSVPFTGGWIFILSGLIIAAVTVYEYFFCPDCKNEKKNKSIISMTMFSILLLIFSSCSIGPEPIQYGKDGCHFCKMTIMDNKFGSELISEKGKVYKFDDLSCMVKYMKSAKTIDNNYKFILVNDFQKSGELIDCKSATFMKNESFRSPMRGDVAAFSSRDAAKAFGAELLTWESVFALF